mmetsp:Transcript_39388/g.93251  ORF Transcript_39388/g.93251 Transcript_39388/m.93251 type:complete len:348 (-) Transcript_39388:9371-10414(-)
MPVHRPHGVLEEGAERGGSVVPRPDRPLHPVRDPVGVLHGREDPGDDHGGEHPDVGAEGARACRVPHQRHHHTGRQSRRLNPRPERHGRRNHSRAPGPRRLRNNRHPPPHPPHPFPVGRGDHHGPLPRIFPVQAAAAPDDRAVRAGQGGHGRGDRRARLRQRLPRRALERGHRRLLCHGWPVARGDRNGRGLFARRRFHGPQRDPGLHRRHPDSEADQGSQHHQGGLREHHHHALQPRETVEPALRLQLHRLILAPGVVALYGGGRRGRAAGARAAEPGHPVGPDDRERAQLHRGRASQQGAHVPHPQHRPRHPRLRTRALPGPRIDAGRGVGAGPLQRGMRRQMHE